MYICTFSVNSNLNHCTECIADTAFPSSNQGKPMPTTDIIIKNLKHLMAIHKYTMADVARRSGVTPRGVKFILDGDRIPNVDTTEQLARAFGLRGWHLLNPDLDHDLINSPTVSRLISDYAKSSPEGRKIISEIAAREASR